MAKEFSWCGFTWDQIEKMSTEEFIRYIPSRERRTFRRGLSDAMKKLVKDVQESKGAIKTHCRDMVVTPLFVGKTIHVHSGKEFVPIIIDKDMLGHRLGEFALTRRRVAHSAPGIGATRSSASLSVK